MHSQSDIDQGVRAALFDEIAKDTPILLKLAAHAGLYGRQHDADAVFICGRTCGKVYCGFMVGCTLFTGIGIRRFLEEIHDGNMDSARQTLDWLIAHMEEQLANKPLYFMPVSVGSEPWHSFRGHQLRTYAEIRAYRKRETN